MSALAFTLLYSKNQNVDLSARENKTDYSRNEKDLLN